MFQAIQAFDLSVLWSMRSVHVQALTWLAFAVSTLAWKGWLWWAVIIGCWLRGKREFSAQLGLSLLLATVAGLPLKSLIARARPDLYASQQLNIAMPELLSTTHSFPSGHTLLAAAFAFVVLKHYKGPKAWLAFLFVVLVGLARIYQGMHWPSDVIGSVFLGAAAAYAADLLCRTSWIKGLISAPQAAFRSSAATASNAAAPGAKTAQETTLSAKR